MAMPGRNSYAIRSPWTQACQMVQPPSRQAPPQNDRNHQAMRAFQYISAPGGCISPAREGSYLKPHAERNSRGVSFTDGENHCVSVTQKQIGRMNLNVNYAEGCGRSEDDRWSVQARGENGLLGPGPIGSPYLCDGTVSVYLPYCTHGSLMAHGHACNFRSSYLMR